MSWLDEIKREGERNEDEERVKKLIVERFSANIKSYLLRVAKQGVNAANKALSREDFVKVEEPRVGRFDNDFCVFIDTLPPSYLYVKFDYENVLITRSLSNKEESSLSTTDEPAFELVPLLIGLTVDNQPYLSINGKRLNDEDVARELVEPVLTSHRKSK